MKEYIGTALIGAVGPDLEYATARDSIERIFRTPGDTGPRYVRATKGYEARQLLIDALMESKHDFLLMLDSDMVFPQDTLQKLRSHKLPFVSGAYMRRQFKPVMAPVWFNYTGKSVWPRMPATNVPSQLTKIDATGWGCMLIHRDVVQDVRDKVLKGEKDILEDDMDVYPYDLERVMGAINGLVDLVEEKARPRTLRTAVEKYARVLQEEIRPLRGTNDVVGSDIRYPFYAKLAGYDLYLDPSVAPGHVLPYPLRPDDYIGAGEEYHADVKRVNGKKVRESRKEWKKRIEQLKRAEI